MNQVKEGKLSDLGVLFERHHVALYNFFVRITRNRAESEDLTQNTFMRMLKYRKSFDSKYAFKPWMYQLARNQQYDQYRKRRRQEEMVPERIEARDIEIAAFDNSEKQYQKQDLKEALAKLPDDYRELIIMSRYQGLKYEEIGRVVGTTVGAVKIKMHRAMRKLKLSLEENGSRT